jgi:hypothetical protein
MFASDVLTGRRTGTARRAGGNTGRNAEWMVDLKNIGAIYEYYL